MQVFLGLGSNLDAKTHIDLALEKLNQTFGELKQSARYKSQAVGFDGPDFINMVVGFSSTLSPKSIALKCQEIETAVGRIRETESGNCSRTIDIDLLLFIEEQGESLPNLPVPRTDIRDFAYAAMPLAELIPDWRHELIGNIPLIDHVATKVLLNQMIKVKS